jgi:hypothetical protein
MLSTPSRFCPNPDCRLHKNDRAMTNWYYKNGSYLTKTYGRIQVYQCRYCRRRFSEKTFHIDYFAKRVLSYEDLMNSLISTENIRDLTRRFSVSTGTIQNKLERLKRQSIACHIEARSDVCFNETLVADGFESFAVSQYFPDNTTILAGAESQFIYSMDYVTIRRKGRMTPYQKRKRARLEEQFKANPRGIRSSFANICRDLAANVRKTQLSQVTLATDEHFQYPRAISDVIGKERMIGKTQLVHKRYSSKAARTVSNPLFSLNYLDRQIRKNLACHVRETVQFSRNVNDSVNRFWIFLLHHNYFKEYRIGQKDKKELTHAEVAGVSKDKIVKLRNRVFNDRAFFGLIRITGYLKQHWMRGFVNPLKNSVEYLPKYAYA